MATDEITRQIIRQIVQESTLVLKTKVESKHVSAEKLVMEEEALEELQDNEEAHKIVKDLFSAKNQPTVDPFQVSEILAAFMMRAVVLNPENGFDIQKELSKLQVQQLIQNITASGVFWMETVRIQVYFDTHFPAQYEFLHKEKLFKVEQSLSLLHDIINTKSKNVPAYENLYRQIVAYILAKSKFGNPTDLRVIREATALESVFPQSELNGFIGLSPTEKESQLNGLCNLVTGIRLFNKQLGKGGEAIESLPELCATELRQLSLLVRQYTEESEHSIQAYKAVLDYEASNSSSEVSQEWADKFKQALVFQRQYLIYLDAIQEKVITAKQTLISIGEKFDATLAELKIACKAKTTVPVDQPQFVKLAKCWNEWMDQLFLLAFQRGIIDKLYSHAKNVTIEITPIIKVLSEPFKKDVDPEIFPEDRIIENATKTMTELSLINANAEVIHPGNMTQYFKLPVEFGGFCPIAVVNRGIAIPGDKNIGLIRFKDQIISFETLDSAIQFLKAPQDYLESLIHCAKCHPEYVQLMHLYKYFPTVEALENSKSFTKQRLLGQMPLVSEMGCQVDTHIIETHFDNKYHWNEWELRREALMLDTFHTNKGKPIQKGFRNTILSEKATLFNHRESFTQTMRNSNTNVPRTVHYLKGLRNSGEPVTKSLYEPTGQTRRHFKVVDLTIDHDGTQVPYKK